MYTRGANDVVSGAYDTEGRFFPLDSLPTTINKDTSGNVVSIVATSLSGKLTWTQSYTYTSTSTVISGWVRTGMGV